MKIEEARIERQILAKDIEMLMKIFTERTGLSIRNILGGRRDECFAVKYRVIVDIEI